MIVFGIIGLLVMSYSVWLKSEKRQDILFILGGVSLLAYSLYIQDIIFIVLQVVFIASAALELTKISQKK